MKRDLVKLSELSAEEILSLLDMADALKQARAEGRPTPFLAGKTLGMIFRKSSTRTRISFEVGMFQLGGLSLYLNADQLQLGRGETVADSARIFSRYLDGLVIRTYAQEEVEELARESDIPVINALTDRYHPCQILADLQTIREKRGTLDGVKVVYVGDGNNVAHSWLLGAAIVGIDLTVATPVGYEPDEGVVEEASKLAYRSGATLRLMHEPDKAVENADVLYTDTWISMGQDEEAEKRRADFSGFIIDDRLMRKANKDVMVMHCLPAHRGEEISEDAIDGPHSAVWDQAENRLHAQKALLLKLIGGFDSLPS